MLGYSALSTVENRHFAPLGAVRTQCQRSRSRCYDFAVSAPLDSDHLWILGTLIQSPETTLLLLEMQADGFAPPHPTSGQETEDDLLRALQDLAAAGWVESRTDATGLDGPEEGCGIPEYAEGRQVVTWWEVTQSGREAFFSADAEARGRE